MAQAQAQLAQPVRQHPRVEADFVVRLEGPTQSVLTRAVDLSLAGMAIHDPAGELRRAIFDRVAIAIPGEPELTVRVRVARREGDRVAVVFEELDWDDLFLLARYLSPRL